MTLAAAADGDIQMVHIARARMIPDIAGYPARIFVFFSCRRDRASNLR